MPTLAVDGELFRGNDSHDLMRAALDDPTPLREGELSGVDTIPVGVERRRWPARQSPGPWILR